MKRTSEMHRGPAVRRPTVRMLATALAGVAMLAGCGGGGEPTGPSPNPEVASVRVTSPIDSVMAVSRSTQLDAVALDAAADPVAGAAFTWSSSDEAVVTVSGAGVVQGLQAGSATLTAATQGASGTFRMRVVAADLAAITALLDDAYTAALVASLSDAPGGAVQAPVDDCADALATGHVLAVRDCLQAIDSEAPTDPSDRVLLAVLGLVAERAEQLLNL